MKPLALIIVFVLIGIQGGVWAADPAREGLDRVEELFLEAHTYRVQYHVVARAVELDHPVDGDPAPAEFREILLRKIRYQEGPTVKLRRDKRTAYPVNLVHAAKYDHVLSTPGSCLRGFDLQPVQSVRQLGEIRYAGSDGLVEFDPFLMCVKSLGSHDGIETGFEEGWADVRTIGSRLREDGRFSITAVNKLGMGAVELTFSKHPRWAVEEYKLYVTTAEKINYLEATLADVKDFKLYCSTRTRWTKIGDRWVPDRVNLFREGKYVNNSGQAPNREIEFQFRDWRFGKDVPQELLDPEKFTPQGIMETCPYDKWESLFIKRAPGK